MAEVRRVVLDIWKSLMSFNGRGKGRDEKSFL